MSCSPSCIIATSHAAILAFCASGVKTSLIADSQKKSSMEAAPLQIKSFTTCTDAFTNSQTQERRERQKRGREGERERARVR